MNQSLTGFSESFLLKVVGFQSNKRAKEGQEDDKAVLGEWADLVKIEDFQKYEKARKEIDWALGFREPRPRYNRWEYQEILEKGVLPLAKRQPYRTARILVDAVASMVRLGFDQNQLENIGREDYSTSWCERVHKTDKSYRSSKEILVHTLTFACEKVYEQAPESVLALDQVLQDQRWNIFTRIRQHLYALHPNERTKPWIRKIVLTHQDYGKWEYWFEFQRMIRLACEKLGMDLLSVDEREKIFEAILHGPPKQDFQELMGDRFTEELFEKRKHHFQKMQLRPFGPILFGSYLDYFHKLADKEEEPIEDDDYPPYKSEGARHVEQRSPESIGELSNMPDEKLLLFLNEWDDVHYDKDDWSVSFTFEGLAKAFQSVFKEEILHDEARLHFWIANRKEIKRPVYIRSIISAVCEHVELKHFDMLDQWFSLCEWVLSHPDYLVEKQFIHSDAITEYSDWQSSRRKVGDFVETCLKNEVDVPITSRVSLGALLDKLCTQYDRRLDEEKPVLLNRDDQLTEAINNTRSRALNSLVDFGYWVRRQVEDDQVAAPEVFKILDKRFNPGGNCSLTLPEYAILGTCYSRIWGLNQEWAVQRKCNFFPKGELRAWKEAFGNFLRYSRPHEPIFAVIRDNFEFALENVNRLGTDSQDETNFEDKLGEHLFTYYLWEVFPLTGNNSLLEKFYEKTEITRWSHLLDYVGHSLRNSRTKLKGSLTLRVIEFFEWRLSKEVAFELKNFTFWLEAECLEEEWRLNSYSRVLDVLLTSGHAPNRLYEVDTLHLMLENHTALVTECFAKLTDLIVSNRNTTYVKIDKAKSILQAGLNSNDATVQSNAEHAQENLLRCGYFSILD